MKGTSSFIFSAFLGFIATVTAITHEKVISRPTFEQVNKSGSFDFTTYDGSLVKYVTPAPVKTLVEMLKLHSEPYLKSFSSAFKSAASGKKTWVSTSFDKQAQTNYNVMLQDYLPMNEADAAAARYLLSVTNCAIRKPEKLKTDLTMCQYYGARILGDIVKRFTPLHLLLTTGSIEPGIPSATPVPLTTPPELLSQITKIVNMFSAPEIDNYLKSADPGAIQMWTTVKNQIMNSGGYRTLPS